MNSSDQNPRIPLWVFYTTDFALIGAAAFIAAQSEHPLSPSAIWGIIACVIAGAGVALVPMVIRFERQKNEMLDERQRALEALATTVSGSAEQIGIATQGLQQITDLAQKNLRHAEQLPHRLQDKIAEFQSQLANVTDAEKEELEKEVAELRGAETERLQSIADKVARTTAEFVKLEAATHQHLTAATEALSKLSVGTANAIGKAQAAAEQALAHARTESAKHVAEHAAQAVRTLEAAKAAALAEFDARIAAAGTAIADRIVHDVGARVTGLIAGLEDKVTTARRTESVAVSTSQTPDAQPQVEPASSINVTGAAAEPSAASEAAPAAPRRPRKPKREEGAAKPAVTGADSAPGGEPPEPAPVPHHAIPEVTPMAPHTAEPFSGESGPVASATDVADARTAKSGDGHPVKAESPAAAEHSAPGTARKRAARAEPVAEPEPLVGFEEPAGPPGIVERVLTSDGATRLIVTAYIGIGNRLYIRGDGPGLSWNKGVPLQFVSIGKWRWETSDATDPIRFKLLKNDEQECAALGAQTLDPGHQQEVTASF